MNAPARLASFVATRFTPPVYAGYAILWALSFEAATSATPWRPTWLTLLRAVSVVFALLFLRMLDEQKDLAYDRLHNPARPLVTGDITFTDLRASMALLAVLGTVANLFVSVASALVYLGIFVYGLVLALAERAFPRLADDPLPALLAAYPVQIVVSTYLLVSLGESFGWGFVAVLVAYAGSFLHFEFARKTRWSSDSDSRLYSVVLGPVRSASVAALCAVAAFGALLFIALPHGFAAFSPLLVAIPATWGTVAFLRRRSDSWPTAPAMAVVLATHVSLIVGALRP